MHSDILVLFAGFSGFQPIGIPPEVFCENAAPKNFWKLTGKQLCWIRFLTKLHTEACKFIKMRFQHKSFPVGLWNFCKRPTFQNICERPLRKHAVQVRWWFTYRSSYSQINFKIGFLTNFAHFTGKHLCWSLFIKAATLLKRDCNSAVFMWNLRNFKNILFYRTSPVWWNRCMEHKEITIFSL